MRDCDEIKSLLWDYDADGDDPVNTGIREHLSSCRECADECAEIQKIKADLEEADIKAPEELHDLVMETVKKEKKKKNRYFPVGTVAAAALILIVFGVTRLAPVKNGAAEASPDMSGAHYSSEDGNAEKSEPGDTGGNSFISVDWFGVISAAEMPELADVEDSDAAMSKLSPTGKETEDGVEPAESVSTVYLAGEGAVFARAFDGMEPAIKGDGYRIFFVMRDKAERILSDHVEEPNEVKILEKGGIPSSEKVAAVILDRQ